MSLTFSQRMGLAPIKALQTHSMDEALSNSLWNAFYKSIWSRAPWDILPDQWGLDQRVLIDWASLFWLDLLENYLKIPIDESYTPDICKQKLKKCFSISNHSNKWMEVYNFLEFVCNCSSIKQALRNIFIQECNRILKKELSGYQIIDNIVTPITNSIEIDSIEDAVQSPYGYATQHLHSALEKLSDRTNPDYRNSIKESISAVEAVCRKLTDESTLDRALKKIESKLDINHQFKQGLEKLYHYTNGESGIRHALIDEGQSSFDEAKFMLVACSAFVNYLTAKASVLND